MIVGFAHDFFNFVLNIYANMKNYILIIRRSLFLSIIFGASIFSFGMLLTWAIGLIDNLSLMELFLDPFVGGFIGYIGYRVQKEKDKNLSSHNI